MHVEDHDGMELIILSLPWAPTYNAWVEAFQHKIWARLAGYLLSKSLKAWSPQIVHSVNLEMGPCWGIRFGKNSVLHISARLREVICIFIFRGSLDTGLKRAIGVILSKL